METEVLKIVTKIGSISTNNIFLGIVIIIVLGFLANSFFKGYLIANNKKSID